MTSQSQSADQDERVFFHEGNIAVTDARFMLGNETYAVRSIASVMSGEEKPARDWPILIGLAGVGIAIWAFFQESMSGAIWAGLFLWVAAAWAYLQRSTFHLSLRTSAGTLQVLSSRDGAFIQRVAHALNEAIVAQS